MPTVCRFKGIDIRIHYNEHPPPHIHAHKGGDVTVIQLLEEDGEEVAALHPEINQLSKSDANDVLEWAARRYDEILENWKRARKNRPTKKIDPPD